MKKTKIKNERLLALLRHAKSDASDVTWHAVPKVLGDLYHPEMRLVDAMHHLVAAYQDVLDDSRFESHGSRTSLLFAPIQGFTAIEFFGPKSMDTAYTVEQFYNSICAYIFSTLRLARVDWLNLEYPISTDPLTPSNS